MAVTGMGYCTTSSPCRYGHNDHFLAIHFSPIYQWHGALEDAECRQPASLAAANAIPSKVQPVWHSGITDLATRKMLEKSDLPAEARALLEAAPGLVLPAFQRHGQTKAIQL